MLIPPRKPTPFPKYRKGVPGPKEQLGYLLICFLSPPISNQPHKSGGCWFKEDAIRTTLWWLAPVSENKTLPEWIDVAFKRTELLFLRLSWKKRATGVSTDTLKCKLQRTLDPTCETFPDHPFRVTASCCSYSGLYVGYYCSLEPLFVSGPQHSVDTSPALTQCPLVKSSETPALAPRTAATNL